MTLMLLHCLLIGARQGEQTLLDLARHIAGVTQGLTTVLEDLCLPGDPLCHLVDIAGVRFWIGLHRAQLFVVVAQLRGKLLLAGTEAIEARDDTVALLIEHTEQSGDSRSSLGCF